MQINTSTEVPPRGQNPDADLAMDMCVHSGSDRARVTGAHPAPI